MTNLTVENKIVAGTTFSGWVNFGTKDQTYQEPETLTGEENNYFINNVAVSNETAWEFIYNCTLEIKHGAGKAFTNLRTFEQLFASEGIVETK